MTNELGEEGNVFATVLRVHTEGGLERLRTNLFELKVAETVEAVSNLLVHLHGVVTVGQDVQQRLVRAIVEAREDLLLFFEISV